MMRIVAAAIFEILGIFKKNSKILALLFTIFLLFLAAGKGLVADRENYAFAYNEEVLHAHTAYEIGFDLLMRIFAAKGVSFYGFVLICFTVCYTLLVKSILTFTDNIGVVLCAYFFFPYWMNADQIRYFMAMCIVLFGFSEYVRSRKPERYILSCFFASLFHVSCLIFLIYVLAFQKKEMVICVSLLLSISVLFNRGAMAGILNMAGRPMEILNHITGKFVKNRWYLYILYYLSFVLFTLKLDKRYKLIQRCPISRWRSKNGHYGDMISNICILSLFPISLLYFSQHFERILLFFLLLDYCFISNIFRKHTRMRITRAEFISFLFLFLFAGGRFLMYLTGNGLELYIKPMMLITK